jgi:hypothetical protein
MIQCAQRVPTRSCVGDPGLNRIGPTLTSVKVHGIWIKHITKQSEKCKRSALGSRSDNAFSGRVYLTRLISTSPNLHPKKPGAYVRLRPTTSDKRNKR